jgi:chromosome partitioning protein
LELLQNAAPSTCFILGLQNFPERVELQDMKTVVIINSKGGSGKSTLAANLAANYALKGRNPAILDLDPQGSSMRWLQNRPDDLPVIHGIAGYEKKSTVTRSWQLQPPEGTDPLIVDTPAGLERTGLAATSRGADAILIPVMPSDIDIHAAVNCISELLLTTKSDMTQKRIGIVANRVRANTRVYGRLERFLRSLDIPLVATFRDSQNYTRSAELGIGISEMPLWQVRKDMGAWKELLSWLDSTLYDSRNVRPLPSRLGVRAVPQMVSPTAS